MKIDKMITDARAKKAEYIDALKVKMALVDDVANDDEKYAAWEKDVTDLEGEIAAKDAEIASLETKQADMIARAKRVEDMVGDEKKAEDMFKPAAPAAVKPGKSLYDGDVEVRRLIVSHMAKKHQANALDVAKSLFPNDARVATVVRAPIGVPETGTVGIGDQLVLQQNAQGELIELLRNQLVYPSISGMRTLPLDSSKGSIRIPRMTGAVAAQWVGEGNSIPVGTPSMDSITINPYKLGIITLSTRELMERSDPAYEVILRDQMLQGVAHAVDTTFISDLAGTASSPAGLLDGITASVAAGTLPGAPTAAQVITFVNNMKLDMATNNITGPFVWVMPISTMMGLMSLRSAIDTPLFPELAAGQWQGYPVIATNNVPNALPVSGDKPIILMKASEIWFGLGRGIALATSDQAYIQSDSAPNTPPTGGVSLFQQEMVAIRAVLDTTWARRRDEAVVWAPTLL